MDIKTLVNITSKAWALPILSHMNDGVAGRQAPLLVATGASRTAFAQSLAHLIELGLLERNPGHGHPLRPEFRLTDHGKTAARLARDIYGETAPADQKLIRKSWTIPILTTLHKPKYFNDIRRSLWNITDRALSLNLKSMEQRNWVSRQVDDASRPPRAIYLAINTGQKLSSITASEIDS